MQFEGGFWKWIEPVPQVFTEIEPNEQKSDYPLRKKEMEKQARGEETLLLTSL